jgi:vacuolar protein sorting-associated protein 13A/C
MFESLLANLLTTRAAQFIKHIPQEQLRVGVWRGEIVLDDLELRPDCLDGLGLPLTLVAGYVGSLRISIPWSSLGTRPVVAELERLHLVVRLQVADAGLASAGLMSACAGGAGQARRYLAVRDCSLCAWQENTDACSQDSAALAAEMSKQAAIMAAELAKRSNGSSSSPGWLTSILVNKIINLLQVRVLDMHIRIEAEPIVSGGPAVAIGIVCHEVCSRNNQAVVGQQTLQVRGLCVYWDRDIELVNLPPEAALGEVAALFEAWASAGKAESLPSVHEDDDGDIFYVAPSDDAASSLVQHHWVLQPCDVHVSGSFLVQDKSGFKLQVSVESLPVVLEVGQMWDMFRLLDWLQVVGIRKRHLHLRPRCSVSEDRGAWWRYALHATLHDLHKTRWRLAWADVRVHLGQRREYAHLYRLVLNNKASGQDRAQLAYLESQVPPVLALQPACAAC